jgi:hypothetical protein
MAVGMRDKGECSYEAFKDQIILHINRLGERRQAVTGGIRRLLGQEQGLPLSRLLYVTPLDYLHMLHTMLHLDVERIKYAAARSVPPEPLAIAN